MREGDSRRRAGVGKMGAVREWEKEKTGRSGNEMEEWKGVGNRKWKGNS